MPVYVECPAQLTEQDRQDLLNVYADAPDWLLPPFAAGAALIEQCLAQDPRPAYQQPQPERRYGVGLWDVQVRWHYPQPGLIRVLEVVPTA